MERIPPVCPQQRPTKRLALLGRGVPGRRVGHISTGTATVNAASTAADCSAAVSASTRSCVGARAGQRPTARIATANR
ncbi:hypothetical protein I553_4386 [Mycobacterium xenopi 4042]|uniref:Uncharacterized protein n=1 Tax=Mycobacterium xenopi 4042 TaxID=1299334 RepID=X8AGY0_MYCXE|nr:hypothetical protein I553_4386 [Mycobacterium xenopi 4042]